MDSNKTQRFNFSLFIALMFLNFVPTLYETVKVFFINYSAVSLDVVSQIEWFDLINEVLVTTLTVPLYFLLNQYLDNKQQFKEKVFHSGLIILVIYTLFSILVYFKAEPLVSFMTNAEIKDTITYLRVETIAFAISIIYTFFSVVFVLIGKTRYIYLFLGIKTISLIIGDFMLIPEFGSLGIAYANIVANSLLSIFSIIFILIEDCLSLSLKNLADKYFLIEWGKIGIFSGGQIFLDNYIYAVMVCKMVNEVQQQGNYWIANNFIWGWLLVPSVALGEIIKRDCKNGYKNLNQKSYLKVILCIAITWVISIPLWNMIFEKLMGVTNSSDIFHIVIYLLPFYITYLLSSYIDNIFYGLGKTNYTFVVSIIVNIVYYGIVYLLFKQGVFTPSINFIIFMFGFGMVVHLIVSFILKKIYLDKKLSSSTNL